MGAHLDTVLISRSFCPRRGSLFCRPPSPVSSPPGRGHTWHDFLYSFAPPPIQPRVFSRTRQQLLPLPGGEGRGEGERHSYLLSRDRFMETSRTVTGCSPI